MKARITIGYSLLIVGIKILAVVAVLIIVRFLIRPEHGLLGVYTPLIANKLLSMTSACPVDLYAMTIGCGLLSFFLTLMSFTWICAMGALVSCLVYRFQDRLCMIIRWKYLFRRMNEQPRSQQQ